MAKITFIARMTVKPAAEREFTALCRLLEDHVKKHEPGTLHYEFYKLRELNRYAVLESFVDEAAEHLHMHSAVLAQAAPKISACIDGTWVREYFDGFE